MNMTRGTPASSQIIWLEKRVDELLTENTRLVEENRTLTNAIRILDQRQVILDKALRDIDKKASVQSSEFARVVREIVREALEAI